MPAEDAGETTLVHYGLGHASQRTLREELFTDATLVVRGHKIGVHRAVLAANSPIFKHMFCSQMTEGSNTSVMLLSPVTALYVTPSTSLPLPT